jgi:hypothetical protein
MPVLWSYVLSAAPCITCRALDSTRRQEEYISRRAARTVLRVAGHKAHVALERKRASWQLKAAMAESDANQALWMSDSAAGVRYSENRTSQLSYCSKFKSSSDQEASVTFFGPKKAKTLGG